MKLHPAGLEGAWLVELELLGDERGFFARSFCASEFERAGLDPRVAQCNVSYNRHAHTLRGMHWQAAPHAEAKLVRCSRGRIFDVIVDLARVGVRRPCWVGHELSADNRLALYVPAGFAHGFLTLEPDTEVLYQMSAHYAPEAARGARWDDPAFAIDWPHRPQLVSERDAGYADYRPETA